LYESRRTLRPGWFDRKTRFGVGWKVKVEESKRRKGGSKKPDHYDRNPKSQGTRVVAWGD